MNNISKTEYLNDSLPNESNNLKLTENIKKTREKRLNKTNYAILTSLITIFFILKYIMQLSNLLQIIFSLFHLSFTMT